jgi:hypothetical protein
LVDEITFQINQATEVGSKPMVFTFNEQGIIDAIKNLLTLSGGIAQTGNRQ